MKLFATMLFSVLALSALPAAASTHKEAPMMKAGTCDAQATEKKLAGAAKTSFLKKCETDMAAATPMTCEARATEKKLAGAAQTSFLKKCNADADVAKSCEAQSAEKKLAGAAKNSFVKKCTTDGSKKA